MFCCQKTDVAEKLMRCCEKCGGRSWCGRHFGAAVPAKASAGRLVLVPFPFNFSSRLRGCLEAGVQGRCLLFAA